MTFSNPFGGRQKRDKKKSPNTEISHEEEAAGNGTTSMANVHAVPAARKGGKIATGGPNSSGLFNGESDFSHGSDPGRAGGKYKHGGRAPVPTQNAKLRAKKAAAAMAAELGPMTAGAGAGMPPAGAGAGAGAAPQPLINPQTGVPAVRKGGKLVEGSKAEEATESPAFEKREDAKKKPPKTKK